MFDRIKLNFVFYMKHCQLKLSADRRKIIIWLWCSNSFVQISSQFTYQRADDISTTKYAGFYSKSIIYFFKQFWQSFSGEY